MALTPLDTLDTPLVEVEEVVEDDKLLRAD